MAPGIRVLLVDDDTELCGLVSRFLSGEGFDVTAVGSGRAGLESARSGAFALVVLDVTMPGMNGFEVLQALRDGSTTPVLMLSARGDAEDRVVGLELGADDYLAKPFTPHELAARIRAILRRAQLAPPPDSAPLVVGDVVFDAATRQVRRGGEPVAVTAAELALLGLLLRAAGRPVDRADLCRKVLGRELTPFDRSIDTHASNLRRKLGPHDDGSERIRSVRGVGYVYVPKAKR